MRDGQQKSASRGGKTGSSRTGRREKELVCGAGNGSRHEFPADINHRHDAAHLVHTLHYDSLQEDVREV